jgi:CheY-like chemotaxis protein/anti-sigma regulatory factor (Ser/Thr protein kinase)
MPQQRGVVIDTVTDLAPDLPPIAAAENEIREALTNLIFNSVDAMPDGGTLTIRTRRSEPTATQDGRPGLGHVHIEVQDTGRGMDEETRRRCLEPFFTTKGERGTGLGLAMVYGIVQRHSADIEIDSAPGRGTTVRISFASVSEVVGADEPGAALARPAPSRILLVDDDPLLLKSMRDTLESYGHQVTTAGSGQGGIETFREALGRTDPFDLVITDLGMPHVDGRQVARAVKQMSSTTPVVMLTGWGQRMADDGDIPDHVDQVLSKPPRLRELNAALMQYGRSG